MSILGLTLACFGTGGVLTGCETTQGSREITSGTNLTPSGSPAELDSFIKAFAATNRFRSGRPVSPAITPDGSAILYLQGGPRNRTQDLYEYNVSTGTARVLLTADSLLSGKEEVLTPEELARRERLRMSSRGVTSFSLSQDGSTVLVPLGQRLFLFDRPTSKAKEIITQLPGAPSPIDARLTKDGAFLMSVRNDEVVAYETATGKEWVVTSGAGGTITNGTAEFVAQEEMGRLEGYWVSPDNTLLCYQQTDTAGVEVFSIGDPADPAKPVATWPYPRAGKQNVKVTLHITPLTQAGKSTPVEVKWDRQEFPYVAHVTWSENAPPTLLVQNRTQTVQRLLTIDPATGATAMLLEERDPAWINITSKPRWLKDGQSFLWETEQPTGTAPAAADSGARPTDFPVLQHRARDGRLLATLVGPDQGLISVAGIDEAAGLCYVTVAPDSTRSSVASVPLTGTPVLTFLTPQDGVYGATISKDGNVILQSSASLTSDSQLTVLKRSGSAFAPVGTLKSAHETPTITPRTTLHDVKVGNITLEAAVTRPTTFVASRRYPVIVQVYGGPHSNTVVASRGAYLMDQWYADHGFMVVRIDGRGTPKRGRAFERVIKNNLIDIPLADQAAAFAALAQEFPQLDTSRVGITGWSFGGYFSAMATMRMPDTFHCGVAGAPVAAWEDYDTHYTERYMDLPASNPEGYKASNVLTYAKDLRVPLLIIHGTADDNVYITHSLQMARDLFNAGRTFEFIPLAGQTHMVSDPALVELVQERIISFFKHNLQSK